MPTAHTHRHAVERELPVNFKLIRGRQPPACVEQDVVELEEQGQARLRRMGSIGNQQVQKLCFQSPTGQFVDLNTSSLSSSGCSSCLPGTRSGVAKAQRRDPCWFHGLTSHRSP